MGLLVGLPLKLFHILFLLLRFAWPVLLILLVRWLVKRLRSGQSAPKWQKADEPDFKGPVYTVDYTILDEDETEDES